AVVLEFETVPEAGPRTLMLCPSQLGDERSVPRHFRSNAAGKQFVRVLGIAVVDKSPANLQDLVQFYFGHSSTDPEPLSTLIHLVSNSDRHRVQIGVQRRNGRLEEQSACKRLKFIIGKSAQRFYIQNHCRLIAVPYQDLNLLAVLHAIGICKGKRSRCAVGRQLLDQLAQGVVTAKTSEAET